MKSHKGLIGIFAAFITAASSASELSTRSEAQLLKSYAVSQCVARAYPYSPVSEDARATAAGYLEFGNVPIDRYGEAIALAEKALQKTYQSKDGKKLEVMKCIDLMFDPQLEVLSLRLLSN